MTISIKTYLGVDPGLGGALAFFTPSTGCLRLVDTPVEWVKVNGKRRRQLDKLYLHYAVCELDVECAILEAVHSMPGQGVASSFSFGGVFHATEQCLICNGIEPHLVQPRTWKKFFGLSADKDEARALAMKKFPKYAHLFERKKDDGRAESALLALYAFLWTVHAS